MQSVLAIDASASGWDRSLYAFLAEKQQRSLLLNAHRQRLRWHAARLFGRADRPPDAVGPQEAFAWVYGIGPSDKQPSATTVGARIACLSSYYRFFLRMELVTSNPYERLERPNPKQATARGLSAEEVRRLLASVPNSKVGMRDRTIIPTLVLRSPASGRCWQ